jgi:hypothetical protein
MSSGSGTRQYRECTRVPFRLSRGLQLYLLLLVVVAPPPPAAGAGGSLVSSRASCHSKLLISPPKFGLYVRLQD